MLFLYNHSYIAENTVPSECVSGIAILEPISPAKACPKPDAKNQVPIIKPTILAGDNFVIIDNPIGEMNNSPQV